MKLKLLRDSGKIRILTAQLLTYIGRSSGRAGKNIVSTLFFSGCFFYIFSSFFFPFYSVAHWWVSSPQEAVMSSGRGEARPLSITATFNLNTNIPVPALTPAGRGAPATDPLLNICPILVATLYTTTAVILATIW